MSADPSHPLPRPAQQPAWEEIEQLVEELALLARSEPATGAFYKALLDRSVQATSAHGGAVWLGDDQGQYALECQLHLAALRLTESPAGQSQHGKLIARATQTSTANWVAADSEANPTEFGLLLSAVHSEKQPVAVVELFFSAQTDNTEKAIAEDFLAAACELAADFHRSEQLDALREKNIFWQQLARFSQAVHGSLDLHGTAIEIAEGTRNLLRCDRASVLIKHGRKFRTLAISGADTINRRAASVRLQEALVSAQLATGEVFVSSIEKHSLPPEIDRRLHAYLDETHARGLMILPLQASADRRAEPEGETAPREIIGAIVCEQFSSDQFQLPQQAAAQVVHTSETALTSALTYHRIPLRPLFRLLSALRSALLPAHLPKTLLAILVFAALAAALLLIPADLNIPVEGTLQPEIRRQVFATNDGQIVELAVKHGDNVQAEQMVAQLENTDLEYKLRTIRGQMRTIGQQIASNEAERIALENEADDPRQAERLSARAAELSTEFTGLKSQLAVLQKSSDKLTIRSPLAGKIVTWNLADALEKRPVKRGQALMTVADLAGPWILEMEITDDRLGHVVEARRENREQQSGRAAEKQSQQDGPSLQTGRTVSFIFEAMPGKVFTGTIIKTALRTQAKEKAQPTATLTVAIDRDQIPASQLRPGATVRGKIYCGERSLGYVWLHELWETVQKKILF